MKKKLNIDLSQTQILVFQADWCPDCHMMKPIIDNLKFWIEQNKYDIFVNEIDVDEYDLYQTEDEFKILKIPSFYLIFKGEKHFINYEYTPLEMFTKKIEKIIK